LILGVEDDGTVTGHKYPSDTLHHLLNVPVQRLSPPQLPGFRVNHLHGELLVFDVQMAAEPVMVQGNGYPVRVVDSVQRMPADKIAAWKQAGLAESWEARPSQLSLDDLNVALLQTAMESANLSITEPPAYLLRRRLADMRQGQLVLRRAAELLFSREPYMIDHPNTGVRLFRVVGTERRTGAAHNVEELARQEGVLSEMLASTFRVIESLLRKPSRLRGTRFEPTPEYPTFAWQEAIVNAAAHRDYAMTGRSVEVWLFDDRMEVSSPGNIVEGVSLDVLRAGHRMHASRNPRLVRTLVDLGFMREQGEGIPRMFGEMEANFLPRPELQASPLEFTVILRNTPIITPETSAWLASLANEPLDPMQVRALVLARTRGEVSNAALRDATGLDVLAASNVLRDLRDRRFLASRGGGAATFYVLGPRVTEQHTEAGIRPLDRGGLDADRGGLDADRGGLDTAHFEGLPDDLAHMLRQLGSRPRKERLRQAIRRLCELHPWKPAELAQALGLKDIEKLVERHLGPMARQGQLQRVFPENPFHPEQAYFAAQTWLNSQEASALAKEGGEGKGVRNISPA
jgi:ATP-dependent DNA helicase RecG